MATKKAQGAQIAEAHEGPTYDERMKEKHAAAKKEGVELVRGFHPEFGTPMTVKKSLFDKLGLLSEKEARDRGMIQ